MLPSCQRFIFIVSSIVTLIFLSLAVIRRHSVTKLQGLSSLRSSVFTISPSTPSPSYCHSHPRISTCSTTLTHSQVSIASPTDDSSLCSQSFLHFVSLSVQSPVRPIPSTLRLLPKSIPYLPYLPVPGLTAVFFPQWTYSRRPGARLHALPPRLLPLKALLWSH